MNHLAPLMAIGVMTMFVASVNAGPTTGDAGVRSWGQWLDRVGGDSMLSPLRQQLIDEATTALERDLFDKPTTLGQVEAGHGRCIYDRRAEALEPAIRERFALAMADAIMMRHVGRELTTVAVAYRLTHEDRFRNRVIAQLEVVAGWDTFQRQGWTLYEPGKRMPAGGRDGVWLGTGPGIAAVVDTLAIMPEASVPPELVHRLHDLLTLEAELIVSDWQNKVPWFVRSNAAGSNQWVVPISGLIRACLELGKAEHRDAYEMGVTMMLKSLDTQGAHGEYIEGLAYSYWTVPAMLSSAHAAALAGDRRLIEHPFLARFGAWAAQHLQPDRSLANPFDATNSFRESHEKRNLLRETIAMVVATTMDPSACWMLRDKLGGPPITPYGLAAAAALRGADAAPPGLYAAYDVGALVVWRSSWDDQATGVWIRGGHRKDFHDHADRGHVNLILHGKPIFIEAGTPNYAHPLIKSHYQAGPGHNVLQLGTISPDEQKGRLHAPGWPKKAQAPIQISRLDDLGGAVVVDATRCYEHLDAWRRRVTWSADELTVADHVELPSDHPQTVLLRWHLGTGKTATIESADPRRATIHIDGAQIDIEASSPIDVTQVTMPDHTLVSDLHDHAHVCLLVQSAQPVASAMMISTHVTSE